MKHYVGLDVSMKETFICIEDETGKILSQGRTKTDPELIANYLKKFQVCISKIGLESGSLSFWLVEELIKRELPAICIDARKMAAILSVQINKTDKNDARGIAEAMRCSMYRAVAQKTQESLEIGTLMRSRELLVKQKTQLSNAVRGFLKTYGIRLEDISSSNFSRIAREKIPSTHVIAKSGLEALLKSFEAICGEIKKLTDQIEELAKKDEEVRRLMTMPGVGPIVALAYKIEIDDPTRFRRSKTVGAYLGMTPKQYSSGETQQQGRISKYGSSEVRSLLNGAAVVILARSKKWSKLKAWGLKIQRKHGFMKARTAVGRKMAVIMHKMMIDKTEFIFGEPKGEKLRKVG
jgi:transposase